MESMPLNAIRAFTAVYETGGVRSAARILNVAHSSVSRHVRELEAWLGVRLLEQNAGRRDLKFTPQGESLGRAGVASLRSLAETVTAIREARRSNAVTISTTPSIAARWLLPRLPDLSARHPAIEVSVVAEQRLGTPSEQSADLALRMGRGPWPELEPDYRCTPLMDDSLFPVMSPAYWTKLGRPSDLKSLTRMHLLHDRDPNATWHRWREAHGPNGLDLRSGPRYASSDLVLRAAAQGLGVALARGRLAAEDLAIGSLLRPWGSLEVPLPRAYWIIEPRIDRPSATLAKFVAWLKDQAGRERAVDLPSTAQ